jgi:hypothetical protein
LQASPSLTRTPTGSRPTTNCRAPYQLSCTQSLLSTNDDRCVTQI